MTSDISKIRKGVFWSSGAGVISRVVSLGTTIVIARNLAPDTFGFVVIVLLITEFLSLLGEAGISSAVVQRENLSDRQRATLYTIENVIAFGIFGLTILLAGPFTSMIGYPYLKWLLVVSILTIPIEASARHVSAMLQKKMDFDRIYQIEIGRDLLRSTVTIVLLMLDFGAWAIIVSYLCSSVFLSVCYFIIGKRHALLPGFGWNLVESKDLIKFGIYRSATVILNRIGQRADQLIVATFLSPSELGIYRLATQLASSPLLAIQSVSARISFSFYSKIQSERERVVSSFIFLISMQLFFSIPFCIILGINANTIVSLLFGVNWSGSAEVLGTLLVYYFLKTFEGNSIPLINGLGYAKKLFSWSLITMPIYLGGTLAAAMLGGSALSVAGTMLGAQAVLLCCFYWLIVRPLVGKFGRKLLVGIWPPALCGATSIALAAILAVSDMVPETTTGLLVVVFVQGAVYIAASMIWNKQQLKVIVSAIVPGLGRPAS